MTAESVEADRGASWQDLFRLQARLEQALGRALRRRGAGLSEYRALHLIATADSHEVRLLDLADALDLGQSSVSRLVDRLARAGLARRESCGDDRRGVYIVITDEGVRYQAELAPVVAAAVSAAFDTAAGDGRLGPLVQQLRTRASA